MIFGLKLIKPPPGVIFHLSDSNSLAAGTTILGMIPLIPDPMFGGMAVTIMGGLFIATKLTIIVLPVFYAIAFNLKKEEL